MPACCCQALASWYAIGFREVHTSKGVNARTSCYHRGWVIPEITYTRDDFLALSSPRITRTGISRSKRAEIMVGLQTLCPVAFAKRFAKDRVSRPGAR